ncbi:MAG TPA: hypothetical protein VJK02_07625 [Anaerolineales bacterium]|nr:hypothetical protein [Anaerolineales bacterium]
MIAHAGVDRHESARHFLPLPLTVATSALVFAPVSIGNRAILLGLRWNNRYKTQIVGTSTRTAIYGDTSAFQVTSRAYRRIRASLHLAGCGKRGRERPHGLLWTEHLPDTKCEVKADKRADHGKESL